MLSPPHPQLWDSLTLLTVDSLGLIGTPACLEAITPTRNILVL